MIGVWPEWVQTGRLHPFRTRGEGAVSAEPFGQPRIGPHALLRSKANTVKYWPSPAPSLRPDMGLREHRYLCE